MSDNLTIEDEFIIDCRLIDTREDRYGIKRGYGKDSFHNKWNYVKYPFKEGSYWESKDEDDYESDLPIVTYEEFLVIKSRKKTIRHKWSI